MNCCETKSQLLLSLFCLTIFFSCASGTDDKNENICSICQESFTNGKKLTHFSCKHGFHTGCIKEWAEKEDSCPICRRIISKSIFDHLMVKHKNTLHAFITTQILIIVLFFIKEYFNSIFIQLPFMLYMDWVIMNRFCINFGFYGYILTIYYSIYSILKNKIPAEETRIYCWRAGIMLLTVYLGTLITVLTEDFLAYTLFVFLPVHTYIVVYQSMYSTLKQIPDYK